MIPLHVTATLGGAISLPDGPVALDGLLAWAVATRDGLPPLVPGEDPPQVEIPVERESGGRFHLASCSIGTFEQMEHRWVNRRFPEAEAMALGGPKLKRVRINAGPGKSYRLPLETGHLVDDKLEWWCIGAEEEVRALLSMVHYLGKRRAVGLGRVISWLVEPCEPWDGFPVVRDGRPLRTLPLDWPGLVDPPTAYRTLTYPYWRRWLEEPCAVPC